MRILRHAEQRAQAMRVSGWPLRSWPTGSMALWTAVVLALLLVFGFGR